MTPSYEGEVQPYRKADYKPMMMNQATNMPGPIKHDHGMNTSLLRTYMTHTFYIDTTWLNGRQLMK